MGRKVAVLAFPVIHFEVMGIFRQKQALPRSETAMLAAADLGPIHLNLDNYRLTFEDCSWTPGARQLILVRLTLL